jgi:hypothetical protein
VELPLTRSTGAEKFVRRYKACRTHMTDHQVDVGAGPQRYCQARIFRALAPNPFSANSKRLKGWDPFSPNIPAL